MNNVVLNEVWKDIKGYEGYYQISNKGKVKSLERRREGKGEKGILKERLLKTTVNSDGYPLVKLYQKGKGKSIKVHRLVVEAFIREDDSKEYISHIDGNKENNNVTNLERCTPSENIVHAYNNELNPVRLDLNKEQLKCMYIDKCMDVKVIADKFNCSVTSVRNYLKKYKLNQKECN